MSNPNKFRSCCGRNIQLPHASTCSTLAPATTEIQVITRAGVSVEAARQITVTRHGRTITYSRGWGESFTSGSFTVPTVERAKSVESMLRVSDSFAHAHLDRYEAMLEGGAR